MARLTDWGCWEIGANHQSRGLSDHHYFSVSRREGISVPIETFMDVCPLYWSLRISCQCRKRIQVLNKKDHLVICLEEKVAIPFHCIGDNSFIPVNKEHSVALYVIKYGRLIFLFESDYYRPLNAALWYIQWEIRNRCRGSLVIRNCRFMSMTARVPINRLNSLAMKRHHVRPPFLFCLVFCFFF